MVWIGDSGIVFYAFCMFELSVLFYLCDVRVVPSSVRFNWHNKMIDLSVHEFVFLDYYSSCFICATHTPKRTFARHENFNILDLSDFE